MEAKIRKKGIRARDLRRLAERQQREEMHRRRLAAMKPPIIENIPAALDVADVRHSTGYTQAEFARRFGFSPAAVRDWEQRRRRPEAAARVMLFLIAHDAAGVQAALQAAVAARSERASLG